MQCQYGLIRQYWMHKGRSRVHRVSTKLYGTAAIRNFQMFNAKTFTHVFLATQRHAKSVPNSTSGVGGGIARSRSSGSPLFASLMFQNVVKTGNKNYFKPAEKVFNVNSIV